MSDTVKTTRAKPFWCLDCERACSRCASCESDLDAHERAVRAEERARCVAVEVDDALILAVEDHVGMGCGAWDMVQASEIIRGSIIAATKRHAALTGADK